MGNIFRSLFRILLALTLVFGGVRSFAVARATTVTNITDQPSSLAISTASNHKFTLTVASAASEGATMTFTFPTEFDTSSIIEDDIDIAVDSVDLTTASDCAGSEQASVAIAADIVTIAVCTGDGGAILAGSVVVVEVGTNASSSGSGTHRVTNPSTVGTYMIALGGTFGDKGSIPLPIISGTGTNAVSGSIASSGGGGGGGGGSSAPTSDPDPDPSPEPTPEPTPEPDPEPDPEVDPTPDPDPTPDAGSGSLETDGADGTDDAPTDTGGGSTGGTTTPTDTSSSDTDSTTAGGTSITETAAPVIHTDLIAPGSISLMPRGDTYTALPGENTTVRVEVEGEVATVVVRVEGDEYLLTPEGDNVYTGTITVPRVDTLVVVEVTADAGVVTRETYYLDVRGIGSVYELVNDRRVPVAGAIVTVYHIVDGARIPYGEENPLVLSDDGTFAWYVPNGTYVVTAGKLGFDDGSSGVIVVGDNILAPSIALARTPLAPQSGEDSGPTVSEPAPRAEDQGDIAAFVNEVRAQPSVQVAADVAGLVAVVLAGTSVVILLTSFSLWPFLQYLITSPVLFFARRKRKAYGMVYNAATKLPVDLAIVRVFALPERKLLRTVVTDAKGKYLLPVVPGRYALEVVKPNYSFPSAILAGTKDDGTYLDVYGGQEIEVTAQEALIAANIPLDPAVPMTYSARRAVLRRFLRVLQNVASLVGVILALGVFIISPSWLTALMCGVQMMVYALVRRLASPRRPKGWGIVYDGVTRQPVGNTIVRLFEPTYNKLIETVVTDRLGRYAFLVGPSEYCVTYAKPGYIDKIVRPLDFRTHAEPSTVAVDVPIEMIKEPGG